MIGKGAYLKKLTATTLQMKSVGVGKRPRAVHRHPFLSGAGITRMYMPVRWSPLHGNTSIMDTPESWIPENKTQEEIIGYRLNLIRGKHRVNAAELDNRFIEKLQDISLSDTSVESEVAFVVPTGTTFSEEHTPFGPSAPLERFEIESGRWDRDLEKVFYDTDLKAADAVIDLHRKGSLLQHTEGLLSRNDGAGPNVTLYRPAGLSPPAIPRSGTTCSGK